MKLLTIPQLSKEIIMKLLTIPQLSKEIIMKLLTIPQLSKELSIPYLPDESLQHCLLHCIDPLFSIPIFLFLSDFEWHILETLDE